MNIGTVIAEERKAKEITQECLSDIVKISRQTLHSWENNLTIPDVKKLVEIEQALGVEPGTLYMRANPPQPPESMPEEPGADRKTA